MSKTLPLVALVCVASLSACATNKECNANAAYRGAQSIEPIQGVGSIVVAESPLALKIPPPSAAESAPIAPRAPNRRTSCLDFPPEIATSAAK